MVRQALLYLYSDQYNHENSSPKQSNLIKPSNKVNIYGKFLIILGAIGSWNETQKQLENIYKINIYGKILLCRRTKPKNN